MHPLSAFTQLMCSLMVIIDTLKHFKWICNKKDCYIYRRTKG